MDCDIVIYRNIIIQIIFCIGRRVQCKSRRFAVKLTGSFTGADLGDSSNVLE